MTSHSEHPDRMPPPLLRTILPGEAESLTPEHVALMAAHARDWVSRLVPEIEAVIHGGACEDHTLITLVINLGELSQLTEDVLGLIETHPWLEVDEQFIWPKGPITFGMVDGG